jgi:isocitrate dehydrogenase
MLKITRTVWVHGALIPNPRFRVCLARISLRTKSQLRSLRQVRVKIELVATDGTVTILKEGLALEAGEVIDATFMSVRALRTFLAEQIELAKKEGILFSLHMKATMMKVSDPIIFGHAVEVFYKDVFEKHASTIASLGVDVKNGLGDLYTKIESLPA